MIKKTYNINLAGRQFVIDDDAYTLANNYLDAIEHLVRDPEERTELTSDIEDRMAELIGLRLEETGASIVNLAMVEGVIERIGQPNDFLDVDEQNEVIISTHTGASVNETIIDMEQTVPGDPGTRNQTSQSDVVPPPLRTTGKPKRRLFRDPMDSVFGGVCSGIAHFLKIDPVWVRLIFVLLALGMLEITSFSWMAFLYILLWIIVPPADTPVKRMEMFGEAPTLGNLAKTVTGSLNSSTEQAMETQSGWKRFTQNLTRIAQVIGKGILLFLGIVSVPLVIALGFAILALIFILICYATGMTVGNIDIVKEVGIDTLWGIWCGLGSCVALIIPCFLLTWYLLKMVNHSLHMSRTWEIMLAVIWIIAFVFTAICCAVLGFDLWI